MEQQESVVICSGKYEVKNGEGRESCGRANKALFFPSTTAAPLSAVFSSF